MLKDLIDCGEDVSEKYILVNSLVDFKTLMHEYIVQMLPRF